MGQKALNLRAEEDAVLPPESLAAVRGADNAGRAGLLPPTWPLFPAPAAWRDTPLSPVLGTVLLRPAGVVSRMRRV